MYHSIVLRLAIAHHCRKTRKSSATQQTMVHPGYVLRLGETQQGIPEHVLRFGMAQQRNKAGYTSKMYQDWKYFSIVIGQGVRREVCVRKVRFFGIAQQGKRQDLTQRCLRLGLAQQCNKTGYNLSSVSRLDSNHQCSKRGFTSKLY